MELDPFVPVRQSDPLKKSSHRSLMEALEIEQVTVETFFKESLEEAFHIQQAMLPTGPLRLPNIEVRYKYRPAHVFSGDFLDYFPIGDSNFLGLYLGDVVGKGMPAALYAALAVGTLCGIHKRGESPDSVLEFLNRRLGVRNVGGRYCSVQYAVLDRTSRHLRFVNAGLNPRPILINAEGCREMGGGGFPCGMFNDVNYDVYTEQLRAGDLILFSTDGLIEAHDLAGEPYGIERLLEACGANWSEPPEILLNRVFQSVDTFTGAELQRDDMTAAVIKLA
ncbi:MAG TPA: PP2C family protein-serine/threonine phosphatase [Terriglobia bacterium]|nr:PP2C family protein-serine/threonine phosphatase [Terriglobia bacterium]